MADSKILDPAKKSKAQFINNIGTNSRGNAFLCVAMKEVMSAKKIPEPVIKPLIKVMSTGKSPGTFCK